jgi:hypothetical protein
MFTFFITAITIKNRKAINQKNYMSRNHEEKKFKAKENARLRRQRWKKDFRKIAAERLKSLERMRKFRLRQKDASLSLESNHSSFANVQVKGKYIKKLNRSLPKSLVQKKELLCCLLNETEPLTYSIPKSTNSLREKDLVVIQNFYCDDEISRISPRTADYTSVVIGEKKVRVQIRHMLYTLKEAFEEFKLNNADIKLSLSKFCQLRPIYVRCVSSIPHNVCVCMLHENMRYALESLSRGSDIFTTIKTGNSMILNFVCEKPTKQCFNAVCKECTACNMFDKLLLQFEQFELDVSWNQWQKPQEKSYIKIEKVKKEGTIAVLLSHIKEMRAKFIIHCNVKSSQSSVFKFNIESAIQKDSNKAVIQVDWAENYTCIYQNETQAAHFGQNHISIFTCAVWHRQIKSFALVCDSSDHTKLSVVPNINKIIELLSDDITEVHIFSDNATSQFKNKYILASMKILEKKYTIKMHWHFFAAMHGKGVVDGIGATVKRVARKNVLTEKYIISSASDLAAATKNLKITVILMTNKEKLEINNSLGLSTFFKKTKKIKGLHKCHYFQVLDGNVVGEQLSPNIA